MSRFRSIKPAHWGDKELADISIISHLFWIGTWNFSDDEGIFENDSMLLRSQIFPRRKDITIEIIEACIKELIDKKFIIPFDYKGVNYLITRTFKLHQRIDKPQKSKVDSDTILRILSEWDKNEAGKVVLYSRVKESKGKEDYGQKAVVKTIVLTADKMNYPELEKSKKTVWKFIKENKPVFIDPYFDLWNFFADEKNLPSCSKISNSRLRKFSVRIKEPAFDFLSVLKQAVNSEFLLTGSWFTFDWILENDKNYLKVIEGNYIQKTETEKKSASVKQYTIQEVYELFLQGKRYIEFITEKMVSAFYRSEVFASYELLFADAAKLRAKQLIGTNKASELKILDNYQSGKYPAENDLEYFNFQKAVIISIFKNAKAANETTIYPA